MKNIPVLSCGKTDLKELGALLERANLVVANDSGQDEVLLRNDGGGVFTKIVLGTGGDSMGAVRT